MLGFGALGEYAIGQLPQLRNPITIGDTGVFTLTGGAVSFGRSMPAATGTFTLTGLPTLRLFGLSAGAGAFALSGQAANLERGYRLFASPTVIDTQEQPMFQALGVLAIGQSGSADAQATTFLLGGQNAFFERKIEFSVGTGSFVLTGIDAGLIFQGYPTNIRIFPRVGRGIRTFATGRTIGTTGPLAWYGFVMTWDGEPLVWNGTAQAGGMIVRTSTGRGIRARAFGG